MKKVITYGTFDLFHEGHRSLLERAKALGGHLVVAVTGDGFDRERGKLNVKDSLATRIESVKATGYADEIIVEEYFGQKAADIMRFGIDIFAIGSDWKGKYDYLSRYCEVVYLDRTKGVSSTELREQNAKLLRLGIISDSFEDGGIFAEAHFVSGLEASGVYIPPVGGGDGGHEENMAAAEAFRANYDLATVFETADGLFEGSDIVYVHMQRRYRFEFAAAALKAGCHVICDFPLDKSEDAERIYRLVKDCGRAFVECVPLLYLRTFQQLSGLLHGGAVGQVLSVDCTMPALGDFRDSEALAAATFARILGTEGATASRVSVQSRDRYDRIGFSCGDAIASCAVSDSEWLKPGMVIVGTDGRVEIPGAWWNMNYFKLLMRGEDSPRRYSFNVEGSGLRYLLSETSQMVAEGRTDSMALSNEEAQKLVALLERGDLL
ncbi:MAG: adenylyltransferase/cytidyltransferase family protein [Clostridiales bacterium]|nr:adenylyltransferase/cytidyltransferase family protein [Clostridiales bacterium]